MNMINVRTGYQVRKEIETVYKSVKLRLLGDQSGPGGNFQYKMEKYIKSVRPSIEDIHNLLPNIYMYLHELDKNTQRDLYDAVEEILRTVKNIVQETEIGIIQIKSTSANKDNVFGNRYDYLNVEIFSELNKISGSNVSEILTASLRGLNSENDYQSASNILLDLYADSQTSSTIIANLNNYNANINSPYVVTSSFYMPNNIYAPLSDTRAAKTLIAMIDAILGKEHSSEKSVWYNFEWNSNIWSFPDIIMQLKQAMQSVNYLPGTHTVLAILILSSLYEDGTFILNGLEPHNVITDLALDLKSSGMSPDKIAGVIFQIDPNEIKDSASFVANLYKTFKFGAGSSIKGQADLLYNFLPSDIYTTSSNVSGLYYELIDKWNSYIDKSVIENGSLYKELATYIGMISSSVIMDENSIKAIELDMLASGNSPEQLVSNLLAPFSLYGLINSFNNPQIEDWFEKVLSSGNMNFFTPVFFEFYVDYINNIYKSFNIDNYFFPFSSQISSHLAQASIPLVDFVSSLNSFSNNNNIIDYSSLASEISNLMVPFNDNIVSQLTIDMIKGGQNIDNIKYLFGRLDGQTAQELALNMYFSWGGAYLSAVPGALDLAIDLDNALVKTSDINYYFSSNSDITRTYEQSYNNAFAVLLDKLINPINSNNDLINHLEADLECSGKSPGEIISILTNIQGADGPAFAANFYRQIGFPYCSAYQGFMDLASIVKEQHEAGHIVTLNSYFGDQNISPNKNYLNTCSKVDDVYVVGGSVFYKFDPFEKGLSLLKMRDLYTFAGRDSAKAQCGRYISENYAHDLYLTLTAPAGVTGDSSVTGCTEALDPGVFAAYCESVFSSLNVN